jgi:hypothetical protein
VLPQEVFGKRVAVVAPIAQRRQMNLNCVYAENRRSCPEFCPGPTSAFKSALVADNKRTSTFRVFDDPTRSNSPVSNTRKSFG